MTVEPTNIISSNDTGILPKNWQTTDESISANDVIDAYFKGKDEGKKEKFEELKQEFLVNLKLASSISEELLSSIEDNSIQVDGVFLKATAFDCFSTLLLLDEHVYDSKDGVKKVYQLSRSIKNKYQSQRLNVNFSFIENSIDLNKSCLTADGYLVRYGEKAKT